MENQTKRDLGMQVFWGCNNDGAHQALSTTPNKAKIEWQDLIPIPLETSKHIQNIRHFLPFD